MEAGSSAARTGAILPFSVQDWHLSPALSFLSRPVPSTFL